MAASLLWVQELLDWISDDSWMDSGGRPELSWAHVYPTESLVGKCADDGDPPRTLHSAIRGGPPFPCTFVELLPFGLAASDSYSKSSDSGLQSIAALCEERLARYAGRGTICCALHFQYLSIVSAVLWRIPNYARLPTVTGAMEGAEERVPSSLVGKPVLKSLTCFAERLRGLLAGAISQSDTHKPFK
jgi:hypothetical protein